MPAFGQAEIVGDGQKQGCGWFHLRAIQRGYVVTEDSMRQLIKSFHPVGAQASMVHDEIKSSSFGLFDF